MSHYIKSIICYIKINIIKQKHLLNLKMYGKHLYVISLYLLRQLIGPFILIMISLIGIVWLAQSLRFIELIVTKGLTFALFLN